MSWFVSLKTALQLETIAFLRHSLWQQRRTVFFVGVLTSLLALIILPTPFLTSDIIDVCLPEKNLPRLLLIVGLLLLIMLLQGGLNYLLSLAHARMNEGLIMELKERLLYCVHGAPLQLSQKMGRGYLLSLIDQDTGYVRMFLADSLFSLARDLLTFGVGLCALYLIHPLLATLSVLVLPVFAWSVHYFSSQTKQLSEDYLEDRSQAVNALQESLDAVPTCKAFSQSPYRTWAFRTLSLRALESYLRLLRTQERSNSLLGLIAGLSPVMVISFGTYLVMIDQLSLGKLMAFNQFVGYLFGPTQRVLGLKVSWARARAAIERLDRVFCLPQEEAPPQSDSIQQLALADVTYTIDESQLLQGIALSVRKGSCIGIAGPSGSGKTTLGHLLCGLTSASSGSISVNGLQLTEPRDYHRYRSRCALLDQSPFFFNLSISENVAFETSIDEAKVQACLKQAGAWSFVADLPEGTRTRLGVGGNRLSAGQRQRIALARALYRDPDVLVLDEPSSNLDAENTRHLIELLIEIAKNKIVFVISHEAEVVASCNLRLHIEDGRLARES